MGKKKQKPVDITIDPEYLKALTEQKERIDRAIDSVPEPDPDTPPWEYFAKLGNALLSEFNEEKETTE